jgi:hypothetical protein
MSDISFLRLDPGAEIAEVFLTVEMSLSQIVPIPISPTTGSRIIPFEPPCIRI